MNYIKKLESDAEQYAIRLNRMDYLITDFMRHLTTPKFHEDTTIQISDVNTRLQELRNILLNIN